jgi:6-phosphogluconolactonase (cycloisomerase 2 family)
MGRAVTASILSLAMALGVMSCSNDYTVSYLYMTTSKTLPHGLINGYQIDYQSGSLLPLADSPIDTGGRDTVGLAVAPNQLFLYTVNNFDSDVVEFAIGTDGKLYPQNTYNISGSLPTAAAIDTSGKFLYVTFTYQNTASGAELYTPANPGPGGISIFPIHADNTLGAPTTVNVGRNPVGILTSPVGNFVYVIEQDAASTNNLLGFAETPATGALTPLPGVTINAGNVPSTGFATGTSPSGILLDATGTHLYISDSVSQEIWSYSIGANGVPAPINNTTGQQVLAPTEAGPMGMAFDLSGKYLYVAAYAANTIDTFAIGPSGFVLSSSGQPVRLASVQAGTGPTCVTVSGAPSNANPSHAEYLYASNALSNNVTGEQVNQQDGSLYQVPGEPFGGSALPTCAVTVPAFPLRNY